MLGSAFVNRTVLVDDSDPDRIIITPVVAIPEREAWLYKNPEALASVRRGLEQARAGEFVEPPDLAAGAALAAEIED